MAYDPLDPDRDPFHPPSISTLVHCIHCGEEYDSFRIEWRDPASEPEKVDKLFAALVEAKKQCGENIENVGADAFKKFVSQKTAQLKRDFNCEQVEYVVEVEQGQVKLKAKGL